MGGHASPTCVMAFGENIGATAYLVGEENRGLENMFVMMNAARFAVGLEGVGISERANEKPNTRKNGFKARRSVTNRANAFSSSSTRISGACCFR